MVFTPAAAHVLQTIIEAKLPELESGVTRRLLLTACRYGQASVVDTLLDNQPELAATVVRQVMPMPDAMAELEGNLFATLPPIAVADVLLDHGLDVNYRSPDPVTGGTALHWAMLFAP